MTNEELVLNIRSGQLHLMKDLYKQNRGIIYRTARKYSSMKLTAAADIDDFMQTGYVALAAAVEGYEQSKGAFVLYLMPWLRSSMRRLIGLDGARKSYIGAASLDEVIPGSEGETTRGDLIVDESAEDPCTAVALEDTRRLIRAAVDRLPDKQRSVIHFHYFNGQRYKEYPLGYHHAVREQQKAMEKLRRDKELQRLVTASMTPIYRHVSLDAYHTSWNSAVELAVIQRTELLEKINKLMLSYGYEGPLPDEVS